MSELLTQNELAERLVQKTGVSFDVAKRFASVFFTLVKKGLKDSEKFSVYNFGTFKKTWIEETYGLNPSSGEKIKIPAHWRIKFTPAPCVIKRINKKYAHLKPKVIKEDEKYDPNKGLLAAAEAINNDSPDETGDDIDVSEEDYSSTIPIPTKIDESEIKETVDNEKSEDAFGEFEDEDTVEEQKEFEKDDIEDNNEANKKSFFAKFLGLFALLVALVILVIILLLKSCSSKQKTVAQENKTEPLPLKEPEPVVEEVPVESVDLNPIVQEKFEQVEAAILFKSYIVKNGQDYHTIAQESLGNRHLWPLIYSANKTAFFDPDVISSSANINIPNQKLEDYSEEQIKTAYLDAYNAYLLLVEKYPDSLKNETRKNRALNVIVSAELVQPGFIEKNASRILPDYAQKAKNIVNHQFAR